MAEKKNNDSLAQAIIITLLIGVLLLMFGWIKSDLDKLNDKVDKFIETYVQVVGELHKH